MASVPEPLCGALSCSGGCHDDIHVEIQVETWIRRCRARLRDVAVRRGVCRPERRRGRRRPWRRWRRFSWRGGGRVLPGGGGGGLPGGGRGAPGGWGGVR